jgi:hypothetical protein
MLKKKNAWGRTNRKLNPAFKVKPTTPEKDYSRRPPWDLGSDPRDESTFSFPRRPSMQK